MSTTINIQSKSTATYTTSIVARTHQLLADEPIELGGEDKGMTPTELLASSLAACTNITMKMYAQRKGWDVNITIDVDFDYDYKTVKASFVKKIKIEGTIDDASKDRLIKIASSCPIHKLLAQTTEITTIVV